MARYGAKNQIIMKKQKNNLTIAEKISDQDLMTNKEVEQRDRVDRVEAYAHSCIRRLASKARVSSMCPEEVRMRVDEILDAVLKLEGYVEAVEAELAKRLPEAMDAAEKDYATRPKRTAAEKRKHDEKVAQIRYEAQYRAKEAQRE